MIGETYPPGWNPAAGIGRTSTLNEATVILLRATLNGDRLDAEVRYGVDGAEWTQPFTARVMDQAGLNALLREAGLTFERWPERPGWFTALGAAPA